MSNGVVGIGEFERATPRHAVGQRLEEGLGRQFDLEPFSLG
jgi:hypothetical protein